jgi:hypothetical protein
MRHSSTLNFLYLHTQVTLPVTDTPARTLAAAKLGDDQLVTLHRTNHFGNDLGAVNRGRTNARIGPFISNVKDLRKLERFARIHFAELDVEKFPFGYRVLMASVPNDRFHDMPR